MVWEVRGDVDVQSICTKLNDYMCVCPGMLFSSVGGGGGDDEFFPTRVMNFPTDKIC